jgi:hypothetical protein
MPAMPSTWIMSHGMAAPAPGSAPPAVLIAMGAEVAQR